MLLLLLFLQTRMNTITGMAGALGSLVRCMSTIIPAIVLMLHRKCILGPSFLCLVVDNLTIFAILYHVLSSLFFQLPTPLLCVICLYEMGGNGVFNHFLESVAHSAIAVSVSVCPMPWHSHGEICTCRLHVQSVCTAIIGDLDP